MHNTDSAIFPAVPFMPPLLRRNLRRDWPHADGCDRKPKGILNAKPQRLGLDARRDVRRPPFPSKSSINQTEREARICAAHQPTLIDQSSTVSFEPSARLH